MSEYEVTRPDGERYVVGVGRVPGRRQSALWWVRYPASGGAVVSVLAWCRSEADADLVRGVLDDLARGGRA